jgi:epoxyqueuosine reductase
MIREEALRLGFTACGISRAKKLEEDSGRLRKWLDSGMHGTMRYMENHFEKRTDPRQLHDGTLSVISVLLNYYPHETQKDPGSPILAKYAYGEDYHFVMKDMLKSLLVFIQKNMGDVNGRAFVDSAPVLDRAWAREAGLGWIGKNSNLISPEHGSFVFIGELLVDLELEPDPGKPVSDLCGTCSLCMEHCPTGAIVSPYVVDGSRCISYFTIEYRDKLPEELKDHFKNRVFGCDICQDVCPWNWKRSSPHKVNRFNPKKELMEMTAEEWHEITEEEFSLLFRRSAVKRTGYKGLKRNLDFLKPDPHGISD